MKKLKIILQSKYTSKILSIFLLLTSYLYTTYYPFESKYKEKDTTFVGTVKSYKIKDNNLIINLKAKEELIIYYNYQSLVFNELNIGDKIKVTGKISKPISNTIFNTFNYQKYLYHKKIFYTVKATAIDKIANNKNIINTIKNIIRKRIEDYKSKDYISTLLLNNNTIDDNIKESYRNIGLSHLFSTSGMHINLIVSILYFYLNRVSHNKKAKYLISSLFLLLYLVVAFSHSLLRSTVTYILLVINESFNIKIKKIDILLLTLSIVLIINPFIIYDIGFIYSYIISFFLSIFLKKYNNKIKRIFYITIISFLVSIPITISTMYEINFASIIINILFTPVLSIILLPLSILSLIFPILDELLFFVTSILEKISLYASNINLFKITLSKPNIIFIVIYYLVILFILKNKKHFYLIVCLIIIHRLLPTFNTFSEITVLDVGQGDCLFINLSHNKGNILIDTGDKDEYRLKNEIIMYLKSKGIARIKYLVLSHGDFDHMGEAINLVNNFKVEKLIFNCGEFNDLEQELIKVLDKKKIKYHSCIKELNIDKNKLYFLQTKEYDNENDNSNVIYTELNGYKFMFMGDASNTTEKEILNKYNLSDIDVLKVGHHGSKTSSGKEFINEIGPKYSIISVGKNNRYGHPNKEVLENLKESKIYRTDIDGSVMFTIKKNKLKIETCSP